MVDVSIIVPVYNTEKYLRECIESLREQDLENIEILLIDDGSTDNSGLICDHYASIDSRITVRHIPNGGVSIARNKGLEIANGKYVGFVDADDFISKSMYSEMFQVAEANNADFVLCDFNRVYNDHCEKHTLALEGGQYNRPRIISEIFPKLISDTNFEIGVFNSQCFCISRLDLWRKNDISYDGRIKYAEDTLVAAQIAYYSQSFYYLKKRQLYNYRYLQDSRSRRYKEDAWTNYVALNNAFRESFINASYDFTEQLERQLVYWAMITIRDIVHSEYGVIKKYVLIKRIMNDKRLVSAFKKIEFLSKDNKMGKKRKVLILFLKHKAAILYLLCTI